MKHSKLIVMLFNKNLVEAINKIKSGLKTTSKIRGLTPVHLKKKKKNSSQKKIIVV